MKSINPYDYQEIAINKVIEGFETQDRGQLIMPCGTGKTYVSMWVHERMDSKHTLVLVPSLALLRQTKNEWLDNLQKSSPYLCVCSEQSIDNDDIDDYPDLIGSNVTSNVGDIIHFLNSNQRTIIFCTYHSLDKIILASQEHKIEFDLAICDEAHKTAAPEQGYFTFIHNNAMVRVKKRLYMTATPRIWNQVRNKKKYGEQLINIVDMNNPEIFGNEFFFMSFKEAIERELLVDYRIVAIGISDREIKNYIEENKFVDTTIKVEDIVQNYALHLFMKTYDPMHIISFHSSIKKAKEFQNRHIKLFGKENVYHINSMDNTEKRKATIKQFLKSKNSIITNARCLGEGVDIPNVDSIYFCDPKQSRVDIVQAIGRSLRLSKTNKQKIAYIVMPLFHSYDSELDAKIDDARFRNIMNVLRSLSSHDDRITDSIKNIRLEEDPRIGGHRSLCDIDIDIIGEKIENIEEKLFYQIINNYMPPWRNYNAAKDFVSRLNLKNSQEWKEYTKSGNKPHDIPTSPEKVYKNSGWLNLYDWLGISCPFYLNYEDAKKKVKSLHIKTSVEWRLNMKKGLKIDGIPIAPDIYYRGKGWINWSSFLDKKSQSTFKKNIMNFEEARSFIRTLKFNNVKEYQHAYKKGKIPLNIPLGASATYKNKGWIGWSDFLGSSNPSPTQLKLINYKEAKQYVQNLKLNSGREWKKLNREKIPGNIPRSPDKYYQNKGWISWMEFLGCEDNRGGRRRRKKDE